MTSKEAQFWGKPGDSGTISHSSDGSYPSLDRPAPNRGRWIPDVLSRTTHVMAIMFRMAALHSISKGHRLVTTLGALSIMLTVVVVTTVSSVALLAPSLVARLAELEHGELDFILSPRPLQEYRTQKAWSELSGQNSLPPATLNYSVATETWKDERFTYSSARWMTTVTISTSDEIRGEQIMRSTLSAIDSRREQEMRVGRTWPLGGTPISNNSCLLSSMLASALSVSVGDFVTVSVNVANLPHYSTLLSAKKLETRTTQNNRQLDSEAAYLVNLNLTVAGILASWNGKFGMSSRYRATGAVVEIDAWESSLGDAILDQLADKTGENMKVDQGLRLREFASEIIVNIPPKQRASIYNEYDFNEMQKRLLAFSSSIIGLVGIHEIDVSMPLFQELQRYRYLGIFLSLLVTLAVIIFVLLGFVVLYSLLMYSVAARNYEIGLLRLLGIPRSSTIGVVITHITLLAIPSWFVGLVFAQVLFMSLVLGLGNALSTDTPKTLPARSILISCLVGIVSPIVVSFFPIRRAILYEPNEAFSRHRPRSRAVKVTETRENHSFSIRATLVSLFVAFFGFIIYYVLIRALYTTNLSLMMDVFLTILVVIFISMAAIFVNFHCPLIFTAHAILFSWETGIVRSLTKKNIIVNRDRNRGTFLLYFLAASLTIYLDVVSELQVKSIQGMVEKSAGVALRVRKTGYKGQGDPFACCKAEFEKIAIENKDYVEEFGWMSQSGRLTIGHTHIHNVGRAFTDHIDIYSVSPNFRKTVFHEYEKLDMTAEYDYRNEGFSTLYGLRGSQSCLLLGAIEKEIGVQMGGDILLDFGKQEPMARLKQSGQIRSISGLNKDRFSPRGAAVVSHSTLAGLSAIAGYGSMDDLPQRNFLMKIDYEKTPREVYNQILKNLTKVIDWRDLEISEVEATSAELSVVTDMLQAGFSLLSIMGMVVCCFSLVTSVHASARERSKEIATLRAIGIRTQQLFRIGFSETLSLLSAATISGIVTGWGIGMATGVQQNLFLDLPIRSVLPLSTILSIVAVMLISAILGAVALAQAARGTVILELRST